MSGATDGIRIAFNSQAFDTDPTWFRVDGGVGLSPDASSSTVSWTVDRGRTYQLDATQTGTASIRLYDTTGMFDATNPSSPFYGGIGPMRQVTIGLQNPVNKLFYPIFTGFTEAWTYTFPDTPSSRIYDATVACVDGFDALSRANIPVDNSGSSIIPPFSGLGSVSWRIQYILSFFTQTPYSGQGYPTDTAALFSGNVNVLGAVYNAQTSFLTAIMDTADAESGGLANNLFMDRSGNVAFRGRAARFTPEVYSPGGATPSTPPINFWNAGDIGAANTLSGCAPIYDIQWDLDDAYLINAAQVYPGSANNARLIAEQLVTNNAQILKYGPRSLSVPDLYTAGSPAITSNPHLNPPGLTGLQETLLFAQAAVDNFNAPVARISKLTFQTVAPGGRYGDAWWNLVTGVEIGDVITVYTTNPGGGGFSRDEDGYLTDQFFVEGIHYQVAVGGDNYPQITLDLDVSPRQWSKYFNGFVWYPATGVFFANGNPTHGSNVFNDSVNNPFSAGDVGKTLIVYDPTSTPPTVNPQRFTIIGYSSVSTVTLNTTYLGTTTSVAPYEVIAL